MRSTDLLFGLLLAGRAFAQPAQPLSLIDVPFISQSEALCGGAAAAMVLRFWGERGLTAESFAHLVDRSAAGIRTTALVGDLRSRGWMVEGVSGNAALLDAELGRGRPALVLVEDRPGTFHYVVVVGATPAAVVFHDPARAPFRAMPRAPFDAKWNAAGRWMAIVTPNPTFQTPDPKPPNPNPESPRSPLDPVSLSPASCESNVASGVAAAQAGNLDLAEARLTTMLSCPGAMRELAGVRLLQRRWPEVSELAAAAVAESPGDQYAWRLLATSRFVQNESLDALSAWNQAGEPRIDTLSVLGLERTRQRVVEQLVDATPSALLTPAIFTRAERRLGELPAASSSRLAYVPGSGGLADLRATVVERPLFPSTLPSLAGLGARAAIRRDIELPIGALTGGGERLTLGWRFWPGRPRFAAGLDAPAPSWMGAPGIIGVDGAIERQPFDALFDTARRASAGLSFSTWPAARLRIAARGGIDRWREQGGYATGGVGLRHLSLDARLDASAQVQGWRGSDGGFSTVDAGVTMRSSTARRGRVYVARAGAEAASRRTPADIWSGGDTGHARDVLLRAHPLLSDGRLQIEQLGRRMVHASGEAQQWWPGPVGVNVGAALFIDTARVTGRAFERARADADAGIGVRAGVPGLPGVFRLDVAKGLRDGSTAVSLVYDAIGAPPAARRVR